MNQLYLSSQKVILVLLSVFFVASCSNRKSTSMSWRTSVQEPFENITIGCNGDEVDAEKGGEIFYASGTKLYIPPNAFVDKKGMPVKGKVTINYREFHSPAEIIVSGIPMKYNNNGTIEDFESAGMFEITGVANGENLDLAPGASIDMWLASDKADDDFNFYRFDEEQSEWIELSTGSQNVRRDTTAIMKKNEKVEKLAKEIIREPVAPNPINKNEPVFEFTPGLKNDKLVEVDDMAIKLWQVENYSGLKKEELLVLSEPRTWLDHTLRVHDATNGTYELRINRGEERFRYIVKPVLFGPDLRKAKGDYARAKDMYASRYQQVMDSLNTISQLEESNKSFLRAVSFSKMGIYNVDRYSRRETDVMVTARYKLTDGTGITTDARFYNVVTDKKGNKIVINLNTYPEVKFNLEEENNLIAILPGDKVAVLPDKVFRNLDFKTMKKTGKAVFKMELQKKSLESVDDLEQVLASI